MKSPKSYGKPGTAETIVTKNMNMRNEYLREGAQLRQENKLLRTKIKERDDELHNLKYQMRELFAQNESQIVQNSYGPKTDRPDLNNTTRLAPNMVDSPRGIIDTSLME
jgi:flagellar basal body-associated protein FliL